MSYTYIIIDDDITSIALIKQVASRFSNLSFVASGSTYDDGINLVLEHQPSFVFLEIDPLNKQSNLSLSMINEWYRYLQIVPKIIITTTKKELAFDALKFEPIDFLLKPLEINDFRKAVFKLDKVLKSNITFSETKSAIINYEVIEEPKKGTIVNEIVEHSISNNISSDEVIENKHFHRENVTPTIEEIADDQNNEERTIIQEQTEETPLEILDENELVEFVDEETLEKEVIDDEIIIQTIEKQEPEKIIIQKEQSLIICIKSYGDYRYIDSNDILYFEADNNSTDIHLNNGEMVTAFKTMKHFESVLPQTHFLRIHNSYIININQVARIHTGNTVCYIKNSTIKLPFSKSYKENVDLIIARIASGNYLEI